ncbi:MAG: site-specific DNA-methyltransferase [Candidatus Heimdallarchaeota archaeon]|nr:MAG: site-specific DNA-methyltransferase [Candidatus Heimdallarchaeota archaeon]
MKTYHKIKFTNSNKMEDIDTESIDLVITSPPYPIIELWDNLFSKMSPEIKNALDVQDGSLAFELMHQELDKTWVEIYRVLKSGGIACINVGDAVRTIGKEFRLYANHSRILEFCCKLGFSILPEIIWRKPTNAPNKFMGSGMLPPGAYITLEHEFILILRKGGKREFKNATEKLNRQESSYFWEERNIWFSDLWFIKGTSQAMNNETRERSAAFAFDLAYRLINMFSVKGDIVLDPFLGTGTTTLAAMSSGRNSIGYELDSRFEKTINLRIRDLVEFANEYIENRLKRHEKFVQERIAQNKPLKYLNKLHNFPVITKQEVNLIIKKVKTIVFKANNQYDVLYENYV